MPARNLDTRVDDALTGELTMRFETLTYSLDRSGGDKHHGQDARLSAANDPVVYRSSLNKKIPCPQFHGLFIQLHSHPSRKNNDVINRVRPVTPRRDPGVQLDDPENCAVLELRSYGFKGSVVHH
jgi:hypothetical protein